MGLGAKLLGKALAAEVARDEAKRAALAAPAIMTKKAAREALRREWKPASELPIVTQAGQKGVPIGSPEQLAMQHTNGFSPYASVKPRVPEDQVTMRFKPTLDPAKRAVVPGEQLRGAYILPWMGDKSGRGRLSMLNGMPVKVDVEAGAEYGEANALKRSKAVLASAKPVISRLQNNIAAALDRGQDVYAMHGAMSPSAVDQTVNFSDLVTQMARQSDIRKRDLAEFDKRTRVEMPGFPGLTHDEVMPFLKEQTQGAREQMIASMDNAPMLAKNFPDISSARIGLTAPQLRDVPGAAFGASVSKLGPESLLEHKPTLKHSTYPVQMAGTPMGRLENLVPYDLLLPGVYGKRRAAGIAPGGDIKSLEWSNWGGTLDERAHDDLMRYLESVRKPRL